MNDHFDILEELARSAPRHGLDFILIGGHAVNARGYSRTTVDVDLLIPAEALTRWDSLLRESGYKAIHRTKAFAQFEQAVGEGFRVDLMLVDEGTYGKLHQGSEVLQYGPTKLRVAGVLHLIALKLHAIRQPERAAEGRDYYDILNLVRQNGIDLGSAEFIVIMKRHGSDAIRERLERDLQGSL